MASPKNKTPQNTCPIFMNFFDLLVGDMIWHPFVLEMKMRYRFIRQIDGNGERLEFWQGS